MTQNPKNASQDTPKFTFSTELGFRHLSNPKLRIIRFLFWTMQSSFLTKLGGFFLQKKWVLRVPGVAPLVRATIFNQFCGGENIREAIEGIKNLSQYGVSAILDFAAERASTQDDFEKCYNAVAQTIEAVAALPGLQYAVFKPSALVSFDVLRKLARKEPLSQQEQQEWQAGKQRIEKLCEAAANANVILMADAEESWIQTPIDELMLSLMEAHNKKSAIIFNTIQFYRTGRVEELARLISLAKAGHFKIGIKAVRGAYLEQERAYAEANGVPSSVHISKENTDAHFNDGVKLAQDHNDIVSICVATHNENSVVLAAQTHNRFGLPTNCDSLSFSQLYGMSDHITFNLSAHGFNASKYIPYGSLFETIPYLMRRAQENNSVQGQTSREFALYSLEIARRKEI